MLRPPVSSELSVILYIHTHTKNEARTRIPGITVIQDRGRTRSPRHCDWVYISGLQMKKMTQFETQLFG